MNVITIPPSSNQILSFAKKYQLTIPEARTRLTREYLLEELDRLKHPMETCNGNIALAFQRLRRVVEALVIQI